jgi:hypothetical protein
LPNAVGGLCGLRLQMRAVDVEASGADMQQLERHAQRKGRRTHRHVGRATVVRADRQGHELGGIERPSTQDRGSEPK